MEKHYQHLLWNWEDDRSKRGADRLLLRKRSLVEIGQHCSREWKGGSQGV